MITLTNDQGKAVVFAAACAHLVGAIGQVPPNEPTPVELMDLLDRLSTLMADNWDRATRADPRWWPKLCDEIAAMDKQGQSWSWPINPTLN